VLFKEHADAYYRRKDGTATRGAESIGYAMEPVLQLFGATPAEAFSPLMLRQVRDQMLEPAGHYSVTTINDRMHKIRQVWRWLASHQLVPASVLAGLGAIEPLRVGRCTARAPRKVHCVPEAWVAAAAEKMPPTLRAMVWIQWHTGMRSSELCRMRPCDIERRPDLWIYRTSHKTEHHDDGTRERLILIGPEAQRWLEPLLNRELAKPCFRPDEAINQRLDGRRNAYDAAGKAGDYRTWPSYLARQRKGRAVNEAYTPDTYRDAVYYACAASGLDESHWWSPHQLRHSAGTRAREKFGLEGAQAVLGHTTVKAAQIYAEKSARLARRVAKRLG